MALPQAMAWVQYWFRVLSLKFCGKSKKIAEIYLHNLPLFACMIIAKGNIYLIKFNETLKTGLFVIIWNYVLYRRNTFTSTNFKILSNFCYWSMPPGLLARSGMRLVSSLSASFAKRQSHLNSNTTWLVRCWLSSTEAIKVYKALHGL